MMFVELLDTFWASSNTYPTRIKYIHHLQTLCLKQLKLYLYFTSLLLSGQNI